MSSTEMLPQTLSSTTVRTGLIGSINGSLGLPYEIIESILLNGNRSRRRIAKLSPVCRHWRSIINQTIEFWTTIRPFCCNSEDSDDAFRRIEWLVQRTRRDNHHNGTNSDSKNNYISDKNDGSALLDVIWDSSQLNSALDPTTIATHFLLLAPPRRWRSLYISIRKEDDMEILENHSFDNLEEVNICGSRSLSRSMARLPRQAFSNVNLRNLDSFEEEEAKRQLQTRTFSKASLSLKTLIIREYDRDLFPTITDLQLIGPQTRLHFECDIPRYPQLPLPSFNQVRHLHIPSFPYWSGNIILQYVTHLHVESLNPFVFQDYRLSSLTHFSVDKLLVCIYPPDPPLTVHLPLVESIRIGKVSDALGKFYLIDAPVLQKLHLGRPERRLLETFSKSPYTHLTLCLHIYTDKVLQYLRPYLGRISSLHLICGRLSVPFSVFPLFDEDGEGGENTRLYIGALSEIRITMGRQRRISDSSIFEEPARRFHFRHSLESIAIYWADGSDFKINR